MLTNFAKLTTEQKTVWSRDLWKLARNVSFINQFMGSGPNSVCQRITELTESEKGARAVITLIPDLVNDGTSGDNTMEGREEQIKAFDRVIRIDQLRHSNRTTGKMADQRSIVNFRSNSRDQLAYWMSDRCDQLAIQTLAGIPYTLKPDFTARTDTTFSELDFAADVQAPSSDRFFRWDATTGLESTPDAANLAAADTPSWAMIVELRAQAKAKYIKGIRGAGGIEVYHIFMDPLAMAKLKLDSDYLAAARNALPRSRSNELWAGTDSHVIDGMMIHEHRHIPHFASGVSVQGSVAAVAGSQVILAGAQAIAMADLGDPEWTEKYFDYDNQHGIATGKIMGFLKPKFHSPTAGADEDFGVMVVNVAV